MREYKEIRKPEDVTEDHIEEAASMRAGEYGDEVRDWHTILYNMEQGTDDDWGRTMDSPAIKYLKREVGKRLRAT